MEENKLVPKEIDNIAFDEEIYGVRVERSKRKKKRSRVKRLIIFVCAFSLLTLFIIKFNNIRDFFASVFPSTEELPQASSSNTTNDIKNDFNDENEQNENMNQAYDYNFIDTVPTEFTVIDKNAIIKDISLLSFDAPKSTDIYGSFGNDAPMILIVNLSPLECFSDGYGYSSTSSFYGNEKNVRDLGEAMCSSLNSLGINAVQLKREYGNESLLEYQRKYIKDIEAFLENNPSVCYIFDISRSININSDMSINCERIEMNGYNLPTVKFICGTDGKNTTEIQNRSIYVAYDLAVTINKTATNLVSTLELTPFDLNHRFTSPCIRIEIGSYANTFEDASLTADYLSLSISSYLK